MRSRITILCGFLLFSVMSVTPAHAGPWSAFVAWLSDLDPKSGGIGIEMRLFCPKAEGPTIEGIPPQFACDLKQTQKWVIKSSAAFMLGTLNEDGGTVSVVPVLGIVEKEFTHRSLRYSLGAGVGLIHVGGTLVGGVTQPLLQARATIEIPKTGFGFRTEFNLLPKGFPAGAFAVGSSATGKEFALGLSVVYLR